MTMPSNEQLLTDALKMDHEEAERIVLEFLGDSRRDMSENEELAFAHIYNCMKIECGEFWQKMRAEHTDSASQEALLRHQDLRKVFSESLERQFPWLNPFWSRRN